MNLDSFDIERVKEAIKQWAKERPFIKKVYLFGSRVTGIRKDGRPVGQDSDLDVALQFDPFPGDSNLLTTWVGESKKWHEELLARLQFKDAQGLDLQRYDPVETPHVADYIKKGSVVIYDSGLT
ncbi:MAG: nucleotidyltransferase domain-containing protein [Candidatus Omnitrophota bacterium]|jgi:predicted nucleotidyltransferase